MKGIFVSVELLEELRDAANESMNATTRQHQIDHFAGLIAKADALLSAPSPTGVEALEVIGWVSDIGSFILSKNGKEAGCNERFFDADLCRLSDAKAIIDGLRGEVERLQRAEKNDAIAYKAALERQDELRAELAALKAQGVVMPDVNAAAKALCNRHAMICGVDADDQWKEYSQDFIADAETVLANARLCAAPAQQVVPDEREAFEKWGETLFYTACFERHENDEYVGRGLQGAWLGWQARALLAVAPAAPAADVGAVLEQAMYTLISIGYHENSGLVHELRQALAAHRAQEGE